MSGNVATKSKTSSAAKETVLMGLMAAVLCILAPISIPLGFTPVPITLGLFVIFLSAYVLKPRQAAFSVLIYLLLGLVGLPVFSKYGSGPGQFTGPTGGFLISYLVTVYISSIVIHRFPKNRFFQILGMLAGLAACYLIGSIWFSILQKTDLIKALRLCAIPFIPADTVKILLAAWIGPEITKRLPRS